MAKTIALLLVSISVSVIISFPNLSESISSCNGACKTLNDCAGQLICINGKCNDDPDVGSQECGGGGGGGGGESPAPPGGCEAFGRLNCKGKSYPQYRCSPAVGSSTGAILTNNDFSEGGDGGDASACDERFHDESELVVALSTGWYDRGSRCGKKIRIRARNGRTVVAKVVDECDSINGCDREHANLPPCKNNIVDGSDGVWNALGLDIDVGQEPVTWSDA